MLRVALTGGIGSGKSEVARMFNALGVPVMDTDVVARQLVMPGQPALERIFHTFGNHLRLPNGELDRARLADKCFADTSARQQLEAILHPLIRNVVTNWLASQDAPYAIVVIPLLLETLQQDQYDRVLVVDCPVETQISRIKQRDQRSETQISAIIAAQVSREQRLQAADDVIQNSGNLVELENQVKFLHQKYLSLSQS